MKLHSRLFGAAAIAAIATATPASAVTFMLNSTTPGTAPGTQARLGFEIAAAYWSSVLTDNVTVNLNIGFATLGTGILAQAGSARTLLSMNQTYGAMAADISSALDAQAVANLPVLGLSTLTGFGAVTATTNAINATNNGYVDTATRIDNDGGVNNSTTAITKASAKALGITVDVNGNAVNYASADAAITFSDAFAWDFDPTDGIDANAFDFIGVAIHEIGHSLGFVSGVDSYDLRTSPNGPSRTAGLLEGFVVMSQLDLFRYSTAGGLDWSTQNTPFFSIDRGASQLFGDSRFSQGSFNGDGRQASHFKDSPAGQPQIGVMDPTSARGQLQEVTGLDLAAFDTIGYQVNFDVLADNGQYRVNSGDIYNNFFAVPEPATWLQLILGFGILGGAVRHRKRAALRLA